MDWTDIEMDKTDTEMNKTDIEIPKMSFSWPRIVHFLEIFYPAWPRVQNKYLLFIVEAAIVEQETIVLWLQDKVVVSNIVPGAQVINIWCPWAQR